MNLIVASILSMAGLGIFFAAVLAVADQKLRVEEDPLVEKINHLLPGVNCGACGAVSCHDFAEHIVKENSAPAQCRVIGEEAREKLFALLGIDEDEEGVRIIAVVHCAAEEEHKKPAAEYRGVQTCAGANLVFGGGMQCGYGCMGFGDCVEVCRFGAIRMEKRLPRVDPHKCTGCGKCIQACPRGIIGHQEVKHRKLFYVACRSKDTMQRVRQICPVGCTGCGVCEKLSPEGFFKVTDNLSVPDYSKQSDQEKVEFLAGKCPPKVIKET